METFRRLGSFIGRRYLWVLATGLLVAVAAGFATQRVGMATGINTFLSTDSQTYRDYQRFQEHFGSGSVVVLVSADSTDRLLEPANLVAMAAIEGQLAADRRVLTVTGPALLIAQAVAQQTGMSNLPSDPAMLRAIVLDPQTSEVRPALRSAFPDPGHAVIAAVLKGDLDTDEQSKVEEAARSVVAAAGLSGVDTIVSGGTSTIFRQVEESMRTSLRNMLIVSIVLMLAVLALVFAVRGIFLWRWLPLAMVAVAVLYTFGLMGVLSVPITMVTMAIFPILIGLGVDYAIQIHNRYDEEIARGGEPSQAIVAAVSRIGPAIGIAIAAACLGFVALFFSPVPMVRDFGKMLIIGVAMCYVVAMFLLLAILHWRERRSGSTKGPAARERAGLVERMLRRVAAPIIRSPAIILPLAITITVAGLWADTRISTETDWTRFLSQDLTAVQELRELERVAGDTAPASVLVEARDVTDPAVLGWMLQMEQRLASDHPEAIVGTHSVAGLVAQAAGGVIPPDAEGVKAVLSQLPAAAKKNLVSDDYTAANVVVLTGELSNEQWKSLRDAVSAELSSPPAGVSASLTGTPVVGLELLEALTSGRVKMTLIGVAVIFAGLVVLFKLNLLRALVATLPIGLVLGWSSGLMYLLGIKYTPATATLGALILGIGTEFTILLMMRYYEERGHGALPEQAMATAMTKIGRAIIASGFTVIGGFAALLIARDFPILVDFGFATIVSVAFALLSTLVVLPPLIVWLDTWLGGQPRPRPAPVTTEERELVAPGKRGR